MSKSQVYIGVKMKSHSNEQLHATATKLHVYPIQIKNNMRVTTKEKHELLGLSLLFFQKEDLHTTCLIFALHLNTIIIIHI